MKPSAIAQFIAAALPGAEMTSTPNGDQFFFVGAERKMPFATIVHGDDHDAASNLSRPGVFRLNIGVRKQTYQSLFGSPVPAPRADWGILDTGHEYAALDELHPHPIYGSMAWVCIVSPSEATFDEKVRPLLLEAYEKAAKRV